MVKKLTDVQRVILATAAGRKGDQVLPLAATLGFKAGTESVILMGMLARGLLAERPALDEEPVWRKDEDNARIALMASPVGLAAIGIEPESTALPEHGTRPAAKKAAAKSRASGPSTGGGNAARSGASAPMRAKAAKPSTLPRPQRPISPSATSASATKGEKIISLLQRKQGATISDLMEATNWQAHSVRGFLAGTIKKKLGLSLTSEKDKAGERRYRIEASSLK